MSRRGVAATPLRGGFYLGFTDYESCLMHAPFGGRFDLRKNVFSDVSIRGQKMDPRGRVKISRLINKFRFRRCRSSGIVWARRSLAPPAATHGDASLILRWCFIRVHPCPSVVLTAFNGIVPALVFSTAELCSRTAAKELVEATGRQLLLQRHNMCRDSYCRGGTGAGGSTASGGELVGPTGGATGVASAAASSSGRMVMAMRRFMARPSVVALSAIGRYSP